MEDKLLSQKIIVYTTFTWTKLMLMTSSHTTQLHMRLGSFSASDND